MMKLRESGDTIVEVLICIAVISTVLGGAFVTLNRTTNQNRRAQERSEAVRYVQSQLEFLKANPPTVATAMFCYTNTGTTQTIVGPASSFPTLSNSSYPAACIDSTYGRYRTAILKDDYSNPPNITYSVRVRWDAIGASLNEEEVVAYYKVYQ